MELNPADERPDLAHCAACTTAYAVGLEACPHCGSTERIQPGPLPAAAVKAKAGKAASVDSAVQA